MKRFLPHLVVALAATMIPAAPARAQLDNFNLDTFIKGLRERNMTEMLIRLAEDEELFKKDPTARLVLGAEMLIMQAQNAKLPMPDRQAALEQGIVKYQELIAAHRENTKRPLWQADMTLHLVFTRMPLNALADDFYEFGVPSIEQAKIFESGASLGVESLIDGNVFLSRLQRELPRQPDYNQTYVNSGRWEEMMEEYLKAKYPFLVAHSAYHATLLPDNHPYFQNLGKNPNLPLQATTAALERTRLLQLTVDSVDSVTKEMQDKYGITPRPMNLMKGKALVRLGKFAEGLTILDSVADKNEDLLAFRALLGKAVGMELRDKKPDAAIAFLESLKDHPLARADIGFAILITDQQHRFLLKHAGLEKDKVKAKALIEAAYKPYDELINDKRQAPKLEQIRRFVFNRWVALFKDEKDATKLPLAVLSGMGEIERIVGRELVAEWNAAAAIPDEKLAEAKLKEARVHLDKAIEVAEGLMKRADAPEDIKARALYNKAWCTFLYNPTDGNAHLRASGLWAELAEKNPKSPVAEESIGMAVRLTHNLHLPDDRAPVVADTYEKVCDILFKNFPKSEVAVDERMYYTFNVIQEKGNFKDAAASYDLIEPDHRDYIESQREWLFCHMQLWKALPEAQRTAGIDKIREDAIRIEAMSRKALRDEAGDSKKLAMLKKTIADVVLSKVDIEMYRKSWVQAEVVLRNFADDFAEFPEMVARALGKRIIVKVKQGDSAEAVKLAKALMEAAGQDAAKQDDAAATIDGALEDMATEIEDLRLSADIAKGNIEREEYLARAKKQAEASEELADMLLLWASGQKKQEADMFRYRLMKVRSSLLTGKLAAAAGVLEPLAAADPEDPRVIFMQGEVLFMRGKPEDLRKAINYFDKLTSSFRPEKITPEMTPAERVKLEIQEKLWWQSWLRRLQVHDKLKVHVEQVPRIVKQLEAQYPALGGLAFRSKFKALEVLYDKVGP